MRPQDKDEFRKILTVLAEAFHRETSPAFFEAYWIALDDIPIEGLRYAARQAAKSARFMPSASELRELAGIVPGDARGELAWETFLRAIRRLGGYVSPDFEDRAINAAVRSLGGWETISGQDREELLSYTRHAFLKAHRAFAGRAETEAGDRLTGIFERQEGGAAQIEKVPCEYLPAPERRFLLEEKAAKQLEEPEDEEAAVPETDRGEED